MRNTVDETRWWVGEVRNSISLVFLWTATLLCSHSPPLPLDCARSGPLIPTFRLRRNAHPIARVAGVEAGRTTSHTVEMGVCDASEVQCSVAQQLWCGGVWWADSRTRVTQGLQARCAARQWQRGRMQRENETQRGTSWRSTPQIAVERQVCVIVWVGVCVRACVCDPRRLWDQRTPDFRIVCLINEASSSWLSSSRGPDSPIIMCADDAFLCPNLTLVQRSIRVYNVRHSACSHNLNIESCQHFSVLGYASSTLPHAA